MLSRLQTDVQRKKEKEYWRKKVCSCLVTKVFCSNAWVDTTNLIGHIVFLLEQVNCKEKSYADWTKWAYCITNKPWKKRQTISFQSNLLVRGGSSMETAGLLPPQIILCFCYWHWNKNLKKILLLHSIFIENIMRLPHLMRQLNALLS